MGGGSFGCCKDNLRVKGARHYRQVKRCNTILLFKLNGTKSTELFIIELESYYSDVDALYFDLELCTD